MKFNPKTPGVLALSTALLSLAFFYLSLTSFQQKQMEERQTALRAELVALDVDDAAQVFQGLVSEQEQDGQQTLSAMYLPAPDAVAGGDDDDDDDSDDDDDDDDDDADESKEDLAFLKGSKKTSLSDLVEQLKNENRLF